MEDNNSDEKRYSNEVAIEMEPDSNASTPPPLTSSTETNLKSSNQVEVCYPYPNHNGNSTIDTHVLKDFLENTKEEVTDPDYKHERQMTAKLDDLLDSRERPSTRSRRFSMYGGNVVDPDDIDQDHKIDRYCYHSAEMGSIKAKDLKQLLRTKKKGLDKNVAELLTDTTNWWIDIYAPTNEEMRYISQIFKIHPLTTEDIQAQESREKCEIFQNYMFLNFRSFNQDFNSPDYLEAVSFYIVVFKEGVLTFRFQDLPHPHNVRGRIQQLNDFVRVTPEWINYALIDNITDSFAPLIQHTELEVDSIDDLVLVLNGSEQTDMLRRIGSCRKTVMQLLRLLGPKADVVRSLIKRYEDKAKELKYNNLLRESHSTNALSDLPEQDEVKVHHEVTLYLGDIQDHIITMLQNVNHYDLILGRAHRNYIGQISIELSQAGNTTNEVINRLTFFATIVVPLNLVGGLFGMNVKVPGQDNTDLSYFFWIVLGMMLYVVVMVAAGKRSGFL